MGREDDPGRASEILFLDNRASGGLRVKSAPFLFGTDTSGPRVRRVAGALKADPEGTGEGAGDSTSGRLSEARSPGLDARGSGFEGSQQLVRPQGRREPYPQLRRRLRRL